MNKGQQTRQRIIDTASHLFERQGYTATGINQILKESGSPRGSFYFHFDGGKDELGRYVIENHQANFAGLISETISQAPTALAGAEHVVALLAEQMADNQCQLGCPVMSIASEMAADSPSLRQYSQGAFETWIGLFTERLTAEGHAKDDAYATARAVLCAIEGALVMCRVYQSQGPLLDVKFQLAKLLAR